MSLEGAFARYLIISASARLSHQYRYKAISYNDRCLAPRTHDAESMLFVPVISQHVATQRKKHAGRNYLYFLKLAAWRKRLILLAHDMTNFHGAAWWCAAEERFTSLRTSHDACAPVYYRHIISMNFIYASPAWAASGSMLARQHDIISQKFFAHARYASN